MNKKQSPPKAVLLKYEAALSAPVVVGKGMGLQVPEILALAKEKGVRVVEEPFLSEALFSLSLDQMIPESLYRAVAKIIATVYNLEVQDR